MLVIWCGRIGSILLHDLHLEPEAKIKARPCGDTMLEDPRWAKADIDRITLCLNLRLDLILGPGLVE